MKNVLTSKTLRRAGILVLLAVELVFSQTADIRGIVSDSSTGERIPFASVLIVGTQRGTSTNTAGFYLITNLTAGTHEVAVSSVGYVKKILRATVYTGQPVNLNFALAPEAVQVGEVVVMESAKREIKEIQTSVQVMDARDLKMVPVAGQEDVFRSIQVLPGIVSTSDVSSQFYVRGGASDQNLVMIDGMRVYSPYHALGIFSIFDSDILQTTEVYTGAFPAGFGGRLSSVVNLISRDGRTTSYAGRSTVNFLSSKLQLEGPIGPHMRAFVNARRSLSTNTFTRFTHQDAPLSFYDVFAKGTIEASGGQSRYSGVMFLSGDDIRFPEPTEPDFKWQNKAIGLTGSGLMDDRLYVSAVVYSSEFRAERNAKSSTYSLPASSVVRDFTIRANSTLYTDTRTLYFVGFEFNFPTLEYTLVNNAGNQIRLYETLADISAWCRTQATFDRLQIDGGLHLDITSLFTSDGFNWFQPRLNASLAIFGDWKVKGSYGRFTQKIVTVNNEDDLIALFDAWIAVPDGLPSEYSDHFVAGIGGSLVERIGLDIQAYHKSFGSLVTYNRDKVTASDPDYVSGSGSAQGIEVLARYDHPSLDVLATYALGWTNITSNGVIYTPRYDRRHSVKLLGVWHVSRDFDVNTRWDFGSGLPFTPSLAAYNRPTFSDYIRDPFNVERGNHYIALGEKNSSRLPPFHRLDISTSYRLDLSPFRIILGASIVNVYDRPNVFYFDRATGRRVNSLSFFPSAMLTVEYQ